jgi:hypothetical protein
MDLDFPQQMEIGLLFKKDTCKCYIIISTVN